MARQTSSPKQRLTARQAIITISIVALAYFALKYGQNVLRYRELQAELVRMEANISAVDAQQASINRAFDESLSPATVDNFAKGNMNWVRKGDEVFVTVGSSKTMGTTRSKTRGEPPAASQNPEEQPENWRLWLKMLAGD